MAPRGNRGASRFFGGLMGVPDERNTETPAHEIGELRRELERLRECAWLLDCPTYLRRYLRDVAERMQQGELEYGDESLGRSAAELLAEVREEMVDIGGWSSIAVSVIDRAIARIAAAGESAS